MISERSPRDAAGAAEEARQRARAVEREYQVKASQRAWRTALRNGLI